MPTAIKFAPETVYFPTMLTNFSILVTTETIKASAAKTSVSLAPKPLHSFVPLALYTGVSPFECRPPVKQRLIELLLANQRRSAPSLITDVAHVHELVGAFRLYFPSCRLPKNQGSV